MKCSFWLECHFFENSSRIVSIYFLLLFLRSFLLCWFLRRFFFHRFCAGRRVSLLCKASKFLFPCITFGEFFLHYFIDRECIEERWIIFEFLWKWDIVFSLLEVGAKFPTKYLDISVFSDDISPTRLFGCDELECLLECDIIDSKCRISGDRYIGFFYDDIGAKFTNRCFHILTIFLTEDSWKC